MTAEFKELCFRVIAGLERDGQSTYRKLLGDPPARDGHVECWQEYNDRLLRLCKAEACSRLARLLAP